MSKQLAIFHHAILANDASAILSELKLHPRLSSAQQFAIYSEGYRIRLVAAIASDYPHTRDLLGSDIFDAAALAYAEAIAPTSYNLDFYPHPFGAWLAHQIGDPFAGELARLEAGIAVVFMLPDSVSLAADAFTQLSPEAFGEQQLKMRTALQLMACDYPTNDWVSAARAGENPTRPEPKKSYVLLVRHRNEVQRLSLDEAGYALLQSLARGMTVEQALDAIIAEDGGRLPAIAANLQAWFSQWVANGVFAAA